MTDDSTLDAHYGRHDSIVPGILDTLAAAGHDVDALAPGVLAGVDEFHLGGHAATLAVIDSVRELPARRILDVGSGIGGPARTLSTELDAAVLGIDLTPSFVDAARDLTVRVGLDDRVEFEVGDALDLGLDDDSFDLVTLFHVGMNIADKTTLFAELARVARPGGAVLVYDIMRIAAGDLDLPLPWTSSARHQHLAEIEDYVSALGAAGLQTGAPVDHRSTLREALALAESAPPPVDLRHLMGPDFAEMFANLRDGVGAGIVAPIEILATKPG